MMKNLFFTVVMFIFFMSCAPTDKLAKESIRKTIIGQNEIVILKKLGTPSRIEHFGDGEKVMIYESNSQGMFLTPNKSSITYEGKRDITGKPQGLTYTSNVNTVTNNPNYTIYPTYTYYFKVYIDKNGNAVSIDQNMPQEQLEMYHERFKHFN